MWWKRRHQNVRERITRQARVSEWESVACIGILKFKWTKPIVHQFFQLFVNTLNISNYSHITYHEWVSGERRKRFTLPDKKNTTHTRQQANEHTRSFECRYSVIFLSSLLFPSLSLSLALSHTNTHFVASKKHTENAIIPQSRRTFWSGKFLF